MNNYNNIYKTVLYNDATRCKVSLDNISFSMANTLGNMMRRVSLYTICHHKVIAISGPEIKSIWSNIPNVEENIYDVLDNLNRITLPFEPKLIKNNSLIIGVINKNGKCTTKDIVFYTDEKCTTKYEVNLPETHLFTTNTNIEIKLYLKPVNEFLTNEEADKKYHKELSQYNPVFLSINLPPVFKFSYNVQETSQEEMQTINNTESLIIELENDGYIDPLDQLDQIIESSQNLLLSIQKVYKMHQNNSNIKFHHISLADLKQNNTISYRTFNILLEYGIEYLEQLQQFTYGEIKKLNKLGIKSLKQINNLMTLFKLKFKQGFDEDNDDEDINDENDSDDNTLNENLTSNKDNYKKK